MIVTPVLIGFWQLLRLTNFIKRKLYWQLGIALISNLESRFAFKKIVSLRSCPKSIKTGVKINLYTHKNPGKL